MIIIIEEIQTNNGRRGKGVYKKAMDTIQKLNNIGIPNLEYRYDYKGKL